MRELAGGGRHFPVPIMKLFMEIVSILETILKQGYESGVFQLQDTKVVHFMIVGSISFFISSRSIRNKLPGYFDKIPESFEHNNDINEKIYKIILKGVEKKNE